MYFVIQSTIHTGVIMSMNALAARVSGIVCLATCLASAAIVSSLASKGYPSAAHVAWSMIVFTLIVLFSAVAAAGLYRLTAQTDHHGYIRTPNGIERVASAAYTLGVSALFLFPPTVSANDCGLFGGCACYKWVFEVSNLISCGEDRCSFPGFPWHWLQTLELGMFLGLTACVITSRHRLPIRKLKGAGWLIVMLTLPLWLASHILILLSDQYAAESICAAAGLYLVWKCVRSTRRARRVTSKSDNALELRPSHSKSEQAQV